MIIIFEVVMQYLLSQFPSVSMTHHGTNVITFDYSPHDIGFPSSVADMSWSTLLICMVSLLNGTLI